MKKLAILGLVMVFLFSCVAMAADIDVSKLTDAELADLISALQTENDSRNGSDAQEPASEEGYEVLQKGSKSDGVKKLQERLIELKYLAGGADGDFGGKTEAAVKMFQKDAKLESTGIADEATQEKLFAADAPKAKVYNEMNFKEISRDPSAYKGEYYKFTGKVLQVLEGFSLGGTTEVDMRIATKGSYDNVVYVTYMRPDSEKRILEDDRVTVYGECEGLYTYETIMGGTVTLPKFSAETVSFD